MASVIRVNRFNSSDYEVIAPMEKGGALHVYHQQCQPPGIRDSTHLHTSAVCQEVLQCFSACVLCHLKFVTW